MKQHICGIGLLFCLIAVFGAQACPQQKEVAGLLLTGEFNRIRIVDQEQRNIVFNYTPNHDNSHSICGDPLVECFVFGSQYVNHDGDDYIDSAWIAISPGKPLNPSFIERIRPTEPPQVIWRIETLNFENLPNAKRYCTESSDNTCGQNRDRSCSLIQVHAIRAINDRPADKIVSVVIADFSNLRVMQVTLDYHNDNRCATVDWILGMENPDWPTVGMVNGVQYIDNQPGGPYLLTTFYNTTANEFGGGLLMMWQWNGVGWDLAWKFPQSDGFLPTYLNTPHMGEFLSDPVTGEDWVFYSHSRGNSADWRVEDKSFGGTYGVLQPGRTPADPPAYLGDWVTYLGDPERQTHYSRDVDILEDGSLLLIDAGCEGNVAGCPEGRVFHTKPFQYGQLPSEKDGNYTPDKSQLNILPIPAEEIEDVYTCGYLPLFEAEWISWHQMGATLKQAVQKEVTRPCPPPNQSY